MSPIWVSSRGGYRRADRVLMLDKYLRDGDNSAMQPVTYPVTLIHYSARMTHSRSQLNGSGHRVMVVDDDVILAEASAEILRSMGLTALTCSDSRLAFSMLKLFDPHLLITDYDMPDVHGGRLAQMCRQNNIWIPILLLTGKSVVPHPYGRYVDVHIVKGEVGPRGIIDTVLRLLDGAKGTALLARRDLGIQDADHLVSSP